MSARARELLKKTAPPMGRDPNAETPKRRAKAAPSPAPTTDAARRRALQARVRQWRALLVEMRGSGARREMIAAQQHIDSAQDALHALDAAAALGRVADAEQRALLMVRAAIAAGSHVAARGGEEAYQRLRSARLAAEEDARRREADRLTPTEAMAGLLEVIDQFPDSDRAALLAHLQRSVFRADRPLQEH